MHRHLELAEATAKRMFEDFKDPINRGPRFTWEAFPELVAGIVKTHLFMHYATLPDNFSELQEQASAHARTKAAELAAALPHPMH